MSNPRLGKRQDVVLRFLCLLLAAVVLLAACASPPGTASGPLTSATHVFEAMGPGATAAPGALTPTSTGGAALAGAAVTRSEGAAATGSPAFAVTPPAASTAGPAEKTAAAATPAPRSAQALADGLVEPDDLAVGPDGSLYVSDVGDGTIRRIAPDGQVTLLLSGLGEPEGMVVLPGGELIIAEQSRNRLLRYDPATRRLTPFFQLTNRSGALGVDGIALDGHDPAHPSLLVPDSANGTLLRLSLDGKQARTVARGFVRPVAAWAEPDGSILVADEFGDRLVRLRPDGERETVARLPQPDDVVEDGAGRIYANTLRDGAVHEIDAGGADRVVASGLGMPQGLALDAGGALVATDPGRHRVVRLAEP